MATIYRFLVEDRATKSIGKDVVVSKDGVISPKIGAGSRNFLRTGTGHGGVEHNKYSRIVNPLINNLTGGMWEKGVRLYNGSLDAISMAQQGGLGAIVKGVGFALVAQLAIMTAYRLIQKEIKNANEANQSNFLKIKSGLLVLNKNDLPQKTIFGKITYGKQ